MVIYIHFPTCLYGVIRDAFTLPNLRNLLHETTVTLYEIYIYIYMCVCVCVCVYVCVCVCIFYILISTVR